MNKTVRRDDVNLDDISKAIRNPLTVIKTQIALRGSLPPTLNTWKDFTKTIAHQIDETSEILDELELLYTLRDLTYKSKTQDVKVSEVIGSAIRKCSLLIDQNRHTVHVSIQDKVVNTDKDLLKIAILKILDNSLRYADVESEVTITYSKGKLVIEDTGWGMSVYETKNITKPFYRCEEHQDKTANRPGLGLSIADEIFKYLGIEYKISSKPDTGTKFTLNIS